MRRISVINDPQALDVLMSITSTNEATNTSHSYLYERNPNAISYPRWKPNYEAILPKPSTGETKYQVSFVNKHTGEPDWPSYAKLSLGGAPKCSNHINEADIDFVMPDSASMGLCSDSMSYNGDFQTGIVKGWQFMWLRSDIIQEQETNSTNYYMRTKNKKLSRSNVYTLLDRSCLKKGERYQVEVRIRIQNNGIEESCGVSHSLYCPFYRCAQMLTIIFLFVVPAG